MSLDPSDTFVSSRSDETQYEDEHVHKVYNIIAPHFSSTRFKPWPVVDTFLRSLPVGAVGLDVGCGNGKYLTVRNDLFIIASDRSSELLKFAAAHQPHDALLADTLALPHIPGGFDFAICIAVVHHLSSRERRKEAVRCILDTLKPSIGRISDSKSDKKVADVDSSKGKTIEGINAPNGRRRTRSGGEALIFVWALEQKSSRRGWDTGDEQDVLVPWVLKPSTPISKSSVNTSTNTDTENLVKPKASNKESQNESSSQPVEGQTYQRYYHLYREGELEGDIEAVGGVVVRNGYDRDNWWAVCTRGEDGHESGRLR